MGILQITPQVIGNRLRNGEDALELSIEKWEGKVDILESDEIPVLYGADDCALCLEYLGNFLEGYCKGCPVYNLTKQTGCEGTPYEKYIGILDAHEEYDELDEDEAIEQLLIHAKQEVEMLKSLRE